MTWLSDAVVQRLGGLIDSPDAGNGRYDLEAILGEGGMGTVYLAYDRDLSRQVALKVLKATVGGDGAVERMLQEARIIARLEHPGIVPVHDVGRLPDGRFFYVMKRVRGVRLDEHAHRATAIADRLRIFERICETVAFAHAQGVIHRDLKPQNVMVAEFGEVLVLDWGVAKIMQEKKGEDYSASSNLAVPMSGTTTSIRLTNQGAVIGTPAYMSPEQARGEVDRVSEASDVYSLGALLYFLLTGVPPGRTESTAPSFDALHGRACSPRQRNPDVPRPLDAVCVKALAWAPEQRYPGARELAGEIADFLSGRPVRAYREGPLEWLSRVAWTYRTPLLLVAAYLVMRILLIFFR